MWYSFALSSKYVSKLYTDMILLQFLLLNPVIAISQGIFLQLCESPPLMQSYFVTYLESQLHFRLVKAPGILGTRLRAVLNHYTVDSGY